jgi:hypothetical protein
MHPAPGNSDPLPLLSEAAAGRLGLLICGHGSRNRLAVAEFAELAGALRQRLRPLPLEYGYLEFAQPILRDGLEKAGIQKSTIEKLRAFDGFAPNAGEFLISALDLTHRSMVFLSVHLLEEAQRIKTDYLDDETLEHEYKIQWQSAYNDIVEQIGKCYDRTLTGTQAMAKMIGTDQPDKKKKKPGFKELKRVEPAKNG